MKVLLMITLLLVSVSVHGKLNKLAIKKALREAPQSVIQKTVKDIDKSTIADISRGTRISRMSSNAKLEVAIKAVAKNGKSGELLLNQGVFETVKLYSRHGKKFIEVYKITERSILGIPLGTRKELVKLIPKQNLATRMFAQAKKLKDSDIAKRFLTVMKNTGNRGYKLSERIAKYAKDNPKSTAVSALYLWFLSDPTGFEKALKNSGDNIAKFAAVVTTTATTTAIAVPLDIANAGGESIINSLKEHVTPFNTILFIFAFLGFVIWKLRGVLNQYSRKLVQSIKNKFKGGGPL